MPSAHWKNIERAVAALLEGRRVPCSGNGAIKADVVELRLVPGTVAEAKHGAQVVKAGPKQLEEWLAEAERDAATAGAKGAVLVLHPPGVSVRESLVILRLGVLAEAQAKLRFTPGEN